MDDAAIVGRRQSRAELAGRLHGLAGGQSPDAQEQGSEILAVHILHGDERHPLDYTNVVNAADVGVRYQARHADFAVETLEQALIARRLFGEELQRYRLSQGEIGSAVDFAHPAAPQQADDAIAPAE